MKDFFGRQPTLVGLLSIKSSIEIFLLVSIHICFWCWSPAHQREMLLYCTILHFKSFKLVVHSTYFCLQWHPLPLVLLKYRLYWLVFRTHVHGEMEIFPCSYTGLGGFGQAVPCCHACVSSPPLTRGREVSPCNPLVNIPFFFLHWGQTQPKVESVPCGNTKQSPSGALIRRWFLCKSKQDSVKMLKARPHLGQYVTNLLVWTCEIHFFSDEWNLQLPKPDHSLPVSQPVFHVSCLNFNFLPYFLSIILQIQSKSFITFSCTG